MNVTTISAEDRGATPRANGQKVSSAIQSAFDTCRDAGGGTVTLMRAGSYELANTLTMYSNTTFVIGAGVSISASPDLTGVLLTATESAEHITVEGRGVIVTDGSNTPTLEGVDGLVFTVRMEDGDSETVYPVVSGSWQRIPASVYAFPITGSGSAVIDVRDFDGTERTSVKTITGTGIATLAYGYLGRNAKDWRATISGDMTVACR